MGFRASLRRRLAQRRYPRRSDATFTSENDHNPQVLQDCPDCDGHGTCCHHDVTCDGAQTHALHVCTACRGTGISGEVEPYFPDDLPEVSACADELGWVTCPRCDWRFALTHKGAWTGRRHLLCGQKIRIVDAARAVDRPVP